MLNLFLFLMHIFYITGLQPFWNQELASWEDNFSMDPVGRRVGVRMIQPHYTYCALYISPISDHQADPGGWGPLF